MNELGLVDLTDINDSRIKLESLKSAWDNLCPGFHKWFPKNWASFFEQSVDESAPTGTEVQGVYYNNSIESQNFREKRSSPMKNNCGRCNVNIEETGRRRGRRWSKSNLRVRSLSLERTISKQKGKKYVSLFRQHIPTTEQEFKRPQKSGKKVNEKQRKGKETPQIFVDRVQKDKKRTRIDDPQVPYFLFVQSLVLRLWH